MMPMLLDELLETAIGARLENSLATALRLPSNERFPELPFPPFV
jgi:hypothetical protein